MVLDIIENYQCFSEKLFQCVKKDQRCPARSLDSMISDPTKELLEKRRAVKRDNMKNVVSTGLLGGGLED